MPLAEKVCGIRRFRLSRPRIESLAFVWVHARYGEIPPIVLSGVLGLLMAFIAYGRMVLEPII